jgi:hypothetical protein
MGDLVDAPTFPNRGPVLLKSAGRRRFLLWANAFIVGVLAAALIAPILVAGIRGAGKYNGVVFYDRWGNCYLFSGVYLMYISEKVKETLRPYQGQAMEVDAKEVHQPMNPGDGLITRYEVIGESKENTNSPPIRGVQLQAAVSKIQGTSRATVEIRNIGRTPISISADALGFAVIAHGHSNLFCPSDGTSCAVITRVSATSPDGRNQVDKAVWGWKLQDTDRLPNTLNLAPGETRKTSVILQLPPGSYQFLAGYGGGVHSGPCVASNGVPFDIGRP